jgi:hypothetical protein
VWRLLSSEFLRIQQRDCAVTAFTLRKGVTNRLSPRLNVLRRPGRQELVRSRVAAVSSRVTLAEVLALFLQKLAANEEILDEIERQII